MQVDQLIGEQVKAARQQRGWKLEDVSDRLARIGVTMSTATLSRIEAGRTGAKQPRAVTVRELLALAIALEVPPIALVAPVGEPWEPIGLTDKLELSPMISLQWWLGLSGPATGDTGETVGGVKIENVGIYDRNAVLEAAGPYRAWGRLYYWQDAFTTARGTWRSLQSGVYALGDSLTEEERTEGLAEAAKRMQWTAREFVAAIHRLQEYGIEPPALPREVLQALAAATERHGDYDQWKRELRLREVEEGDDR